MRWGHRVWSLIGARNGIRLPSVVAACICGFVVACEHSSAPEPAAPTSGTVLVAPTAHRLPPLDYCKLDKDSWEEERVTEFSDKKNGIFVHVEERKQGGQLLGWKPAEAAAEPGVEWLVEVGGYLGRVWTLRIRGTPDTVSYLIKTRETPTIARYVALRNIYRVKGFMPCERLALIELASRDVNAEIRYMAVIKAGEYAPRSDAIPILCRALCDRSLRVSKYACGPLMNYFYPPDINRKDGDSFNGVDRTGDPAFHARSDHAHVLATAQKVHDIRPDLVTDEDLASINSLLESHIADAMGPIEKRPKSPSEARLEGRPDAKSPKAESK